MRLSKSVADDASLEAAIIQALQEYYADATTPDKVDKLINALSPDGDTEQVLQIIDSGRDRNKTVKQIADTLTKRLAPQAQQAAHTMLGAADTITADGSLEIAFTVIDRNVQQYAYNVSSALIVQVDESIRDAVRTMVGDAVSGQYTKQQLAQRIARIIPLHDRYINAVNRMYDANLRGYLKTGMDPDKAYAKAGIDADRYALRLTRVRARTIARTELMHSTNNGRFIGQSAVIQSGAVKTDVVKEWMTAEDEDVCPVCGPMNGKQVGFYELFPTGQFTPPGHINCRCTYGIIDKTLAAAAAEDQVSYAGF